MDSTSIPDQNSTADSIRGGLGASASILSGQLSTAVSKDNIVAAVSTPIPDQNSTAVSIRGGVGASASAACILSGQVSTAACILAAAYTAVSTRGDLCASAACILSGQLPLIIC